MKVNKRGLSKVWEINKELKDGVIVSYIRCELFNPFAKRLPEEIIPKFEIIPRIGIGIRRDIKDGSLNNLYLIVGWLNLYIDTSINWFKYIKYMKEDFGKKKRLIKRIHPLIRVKKHFEDLN